MFLLSMFFDNFQFIFMLVCKKLFESCFCCFHCIVSLFEQHTVRRWTCRMQSQSCQRVHLCQLSWAKMSRQVTMTCRHLFLVYCMIAASGPVTAIQIPNSKIQMILGFGVWIFLHPLDSDIFKQRRLADISCKLFCTRIYINLPKRVGSRAGRYQRYW